MQDNSRGEDLERRLETWAASHPGGELSPDAKKSVQDMLAASLNPVSPLPSQGRLALMFLAVFAVFSLALMAMMDKAGFHLMTGIQMASMAVILICGGVLFSLALAQRMIPGSRPRLSISLLLALAGFGVAWRNRPSVPMESFRRICSRRDGRARRWKRWSPSQVLWSFGYSRGAALCLPTPAWEQRSAAWQWFWP